MTDYEKVGGKEVELHLLREKGDLNFDSYKIMILRPVHIVISGAYEKRESSSSLQT